MLFHYPTVIRNITQYGLTKKYIHSCFLTKGGCGASKLIFLLLFSTSRLRDLQSYHFDKTTESKQIHPYQGRLAVPGHLAVLAAAVVFVLGVSCAAAAAQWCQSWRFSANIELLESLLAPKTQKMAPFFI